MTTLEMLKQMEEAKDLIRFYELYVEKEYVKEYIEKDINNHGKKRDIFNSTIRDIFIIRRNGYVSRTYNYNSKKGEFDIPEDEQMGAEEILNKALISYDLVIKKLGMDNVAQNTAQ